MFHRFTTFQTKSIFKTLKSKKGYFLSKYKNCPSDFHDPLLVKYYI